MKRFHALPVYNVYDRDIPRTNGSESCNKSQVAALFLKFIFDKETLHFSDRSTVHHQESQHCIHNNMYVSC